MPSECEKVDHLFAVGGAVYHYSCLVAWIGKILPFAQNDDV